MANMLFANNANTTLASSLTNSATSMSVTSASAFPSPTGSQYFYCTLADAATQQTIEIVKVTAVSGTTFTIVRGQDGTSGTAFNSGDVVSLRLVRASLNDFPKLDENNTFTYAPTFNTALGTSSGGTALTSFTANGLLYASSSSVLATGSVLTFDGTLLKLSKPSPSGNIFQIDNNSTYGIVVNSSTQVGINNSSPISPLDVRVSSGEVARFALASSSSNLVNIIIGKTTLTTEGLSLQYDGSTGNSIINSIYSGGSLIFKSANTQAMQIAASGGVSIGNTTDPGATNLSVTGTIASANIIKISSGYFQNNSTAGTYSFDVSSNATVIANTATLNFSNFAGMIIINCLNVGNTTMYLVGGGNVTTVASAGASQGTITLNSGISGYTFTNNTGANYTFAFYLLRLRTNA